MISNWTGGLKILSMGINTVHALDGMNQKLSIKSIKSTLSTPIAPALNQTAPDKLYFTNWIDGPIFTYSA
ncbi:MAG: hypothetical protein DRI65_05925 [Chloroflexota bacterium]|nr:MAG: hypothetical protein DRI65_05925 [Chloroflexota bacterium]